MRNYVELSNQIKHYSSEHERLSINVNMIKKKSDEEVEFFLNDIDALATMCWN